MINETNDIDFDMFTLIPFKDQLVKCNNIITEDDSSNVDSKDAGENSSAPDAEPRNEPSTSKSNNFQVCKDVIPCVPDSEQDEGLQGLGVSVYDQTQFESKVMDQVDKAIKDEEEKKRKDEVQRELKTVVEDIKFAKKRLNHIEKALSMAPKDSSSMTPLAKRELVSIKKEQENKLKHLKKLEAKQKALQACMSRNADDINSSLQETFDGNGEDDLDEETKYHLQKVFSSKETEEERLIRLGEMTPFGTDMTRQSTSKQTRKIIIPENELTEFDKFLLNEAECRAQKKTQSASTSKQNQLASTSKQNQSTCSPKPSSSATTSEETPVFKTFTDIKAVRQNKCSSKIKLGSKHAKGFTKKCSVNKSLVKNYRSDSDPNDDDMSSASTGSDEEYVLDEDVFDNSEEDDMVSNVRSKYKRTRRDSDSNDEDSNWEIPSPRKRIPPKERIIDDGNQKAYMKRIKAYKKEKCAKQYRKIWNRAEDGANDNDEEDDDDYAEVGENFKVPSKIWNKLYKYQQTGVRWLWELHQQNCGGIIGDEMGLGKTIQVIAFLIGLKYSELETYGDNFKGLGPVILVCPATVMHQWVKEFHLWWPEFRVAIMHESGSFGGRKELLVHPINACKGILITSYSGVVQHQSTLLEKEWHYVILDEGHKIRNPDAQATLVVKQFRTPHRLILSGSPVQNNLKELWSLFDFIFPGKLGTLPVFMQQFSVPIIQGGYANASQIQVQTAFKCASVLRDTIKPYLLRRMKSDVKMSINLPNKSEQVLFCKFTEEQDNLYKAYINSKEVGSILSGRLQIFVGLINLRKICNHPDLFDGGPKIFKNTDISTLSEEEQYGFYKRSGKMIVVEALLRLWHKQGHRVLLFTQSRQMMVILEMFIVRQGYTYLKMDGTSSIGSRQPLITKFNSDKNIFVFLLTTRVGGLGVNLTGADRIIIYDPDWNPSTDAQARERAWRIGQDKQVTIYRLLTAGTIEEKIYHRQIFKQFVTNRVLKDPKQRRFFKSNDLYELFTYQELGREGTETSAIFAGTGSEVNLKKVSQHMNKPTEAERNSAIHPKKKVAVTFSAEKVEQMKMLAKKLSAELGKKASEVKNENVVNVSESNSNAKEMLNKDITGEPCKKTLQEHLKNSKRFKKEFKKSIPLEIDGEKISFLVKKSVHKPVAEEKEKSKNDDDYVLSKLFKTSGVHTALKHDKIIESNQPDYMLVEGEAARVAKDAIKALKESRRMCARAEEGVPTWTGRNGGVMPRFGREKKAISFGESSSSSPSEDPPCSSGVKFDGKRDTTRTLSSSDLLSEIRKRKFAFGTDDKSDESDEDLMAPPPRQHTVSLNSPVYSELLNEMRTFVACGASVHGQATTHELLHAFQHKLPVKETAVFKQMLNRICVFSKSQEHREGIWHLKEEFQL